MQLQSPKIFTFLLIILLCSTCSKSSYHTKAPHPPVLEVRKCERELALDRHLRTQCTACEGGFQMISYRIDEVCVTKHDKKACLTGPLSFGKIVQSCSNCGFHYWALHQSDHEQDTQSPFEHMESIDCQTFYSLLFQKQDLCGHCLKQHIKR